MRFESLRSLSSFGYDLFPCLMLENAQIKKIKLGGAQRKFVHYKYHIVLGKRRFLCKNVLEKAI